MSVLEEFLQNLLTMHKVVKLLQEERNSCTAVSQTVGYYDSLKVPVLDSMHRMQKVVSTAFNSPPSDLTTLGTILEWQ